MTCLGMGDITLLLLERLDLLVGVRAGDRIGVLGVLGGVVPVVPVVPVVSVVSVVSILGGVFRGMVTVRRLGVVAFLPVV